jgi:GntR family transcriptional regulator
VAKARFQPSVPAYTQLAEQIKARIAGGEFKPGARVPSEQELIAATGLSRVTVRAALHMLARDGILVRRQGVGTFVGHPIDQELSSVQTIPEVLMMLGMIPDVKVLSFATLVPPAAAQRALKLKPGERVVQMKRLYRSGDTPIALVHVYLPLALEPHAESLKDERAPAETTYTILEEKLGVTIKEARHVIKADKADRDVARALRIKAGAPILVLDRLTVGLDGRPLEYDVCHYDSGRYTFSVTVPRRKLSAKPASFVDAAMQSGRLKVVRS